MKNREFHHHFLFDRDTSKDSKQSLKSKSSSKMILKNNITYKKKVVNQNLEKKVSNFVNQLIFHTF